MPKVIEPRRMAHNPPMPSKHMSVGCVGRRNNPATCVTHLSQSTNRDTRIPGSRIIMSNSTAAAVVTMVKGQMTREATVYPAYIAEHNVTRETIAEHVKSLTALAYPKVKGLGDKRADLGTQDRKASQFADKVRNGLTRNLPATDKVEGSETDYLALIVKATETGLNKGLTRKQIIAAVSTLLG